MCVCVCVCVCVGGWGRKRKESTRVERFLSASLACGRPAAMQALAYQSPPTRSPLQVVCVSYIRLQFVYTYACTCTWGCRHL